MKRSSPPKRKSWLARSRKPIAKRGPAKARREKRYKAFLSSAAWKKMRREAILRAEGYCQRCGDRVASVLHFSNDPPLLMLVPGVQVHHTRYTRFGGQERPEDLEVLCQRCHRLEHGNAYWRGRH